MKIEFLLVNNIGEQCSQMTAFNVPAHMSKDLQNRGFFQGICIIDTVAVKWCFSGLGHDGDIYTTELKEEQDEEHAARMEYEEEQYRLKMGDDNSPELDDRGPLFINNPKD